MGNVRCVNKRDEDGKCRLITIGNPCIFINPDTWECRLEEEVEQLGQLATLVEKMKKMDGDKA